MPRPRTNYKITIPETDGIAGLLEVKPTPEMPKPGEQPSKPKPPKRGEQGKGRGHRSKGGKNSRGKRA